ncbi:cell wall-binding repeat protein [Streptococcus macacae]|uniref:Cell wall-binding repeat protein n=1 Tax=Streptococcus macacae NCTC 11558 TaxID=764298 RepID=G5JZ97_9STRE|nr:cell wall-binding repeat protein [Streptococcus macacae]EHJ52686.1 cell wall-binding repeat protein [Streptococcus macacae NCTC 11558]SUN78346.1 glucosyltransferase-I [Streptococcus macacae NCTC 11558]
MKRQNNVKFFSKKRWLKTIGATIVSLAALNYAGLADANQATVANAKTASSIQTSKVSQQISAAKGNQTVPTQVDSKKTGFITKADGNTYYINEKGIAVTGLQSIDGKTYYFSSAGVLQKDTLQFINMSYYYFDKDTGAALTNQFKADKYQQIYYFGKDGKAVDGFQTINQKQYYFYNYHLVQNRLIEINRDVYYFDAKGQPLSNQFITWNGYTYYLGKDGKALTGWQTIEGKRYYFSDKNGDRPGHQTKGQMYKGSNVYTIDGHKYLFDTNTGQVLTNRFGFYQNAWYYFDSEGKAVSGWQTIEGKRMYFRPNTDSQKEAQVKGELIDIDGSLYYFDQDSGELWTNRSLTYNGKNYQIDKDGKATLTP